MKNIPVSTQMRIYPIYSRLWLSLSRLDKLLSIHAEKAKGKLLDIGGENTPYIEYFRPYVTEYVCLNTALIKNTADQNVIGDAQELPFPKNSFDTILSTQVLEHLPQPQKAVDEINRVLKKGGYCLLSTNMAWIFHAVPDDYFRYTESGLKHLFRGFSEVETYVAGGYVLTLAQLMLLPTKCIPPIFMAPICLIVNVTAGIFDQLFYSEKLTPTILIIAKK